MTFYEYVAGVEVIPKKKSKKTDGDSLEDGGDGGDDAAGEAADEQP